MLELTQVTSGPLAGKPIERGSEGFMQLAIGTNDVFKCARAPACVGRTQRP